MTWRVYLWGCGNWHRGQREHRSVNSAVEFAALIRRDVGARVCVTPAGVSPRDAYPKAAWR